MRLCPLGQPAYIRVIRRRSRRITRSPGRLRSFSSGPIARLARCATPLGALRAPRAGPSTGGEYRGYFPLDGRLSISGEDTLEEFLLLGAGLVIVLLLTRQGIRYLRKRCARGPSDV